MRQWRSYKWRVESYKLPPASQLPTSTFHLPPAPLALLPPLLPVCYDKTTMTNTCLSSYAVFANCPENVLAALGKGRPATKTAVVAPSGDGDADVLAAVSRELNLAHAEHDIIGEDAAASATIQGPLLVLGESTYDTVVAPFWEGIDAQAAATLTSFEKAGGRLIRGPETWALMPTCPVSGMGHEDIRVAKRIDGDKCIYAFVNVGAETRDVALVGLGYRRFAPGEAFVWQTGDPLSEIPGQSDKPSASEPRPIPFGEAYRKLWSDDFNAEIDARIEKFRKADFSANGFPAGAEVKVRQVTSDFLVGCNMFNFGQLGKPEWDEQYRKTWEPGGIFNAATIAFYWANFEWERGKPRFTSTPNDDPARWAAFRKSRDYKPVCHWTPECPWEWRRPAPDRPIAFCKANGVNIHGHCIIYPAWDPDWIKPIGLRSREELQKFYDKRIYDIALYYGDTIPQWDVVNESWNRESGTEHPNDWVCVHNGLWGRRVPVPRDYTFKAYKLAEKLFPPGVKLCFNDAAQDGYFAFSKSLMDRGAKIDVSGFQMHIFSDMHALKTAAGLPCTPNGMDWNPHHQVETFQKLDKLGKPIHLSEVTIPSPRSLLPQAEADAVQARMIRDNFRLWFSWPSIYRITYWNLVDGTGAEILASGMYNADLTKKPAYEAIDSLVNHEWRTNLKLTADASGAIAFRGFKGDYELSCAGTGGETIVRRVSVR